MGKSSSVIIHSLELMLMFTGAICIAVIISPHIFNVIAGAQVAEMWRSLQSWLSPPYIYFVINCIIISIVATSCFKPQNDVVADFDQPYTNSEKKIVYPVPETPLMLEPPPTLKFVHVSAYNAVDVETTTFGPTETEEEIEKGVVAEDGVAVMVGNDDFAPEDDVSGTEVVEWKPAPLERRETPEIVSSFFNSQIEESPPLASSGHQGKKPLQEGNEHETLEGTWKRITEGRLVTPHLQKSDTWKNRSRPLPSSEPSTPSSMKKSETFKDRRSNFSPARRLSKEDLLNQDELNQRAEAFINKFNQEMRLQREKSLQQNFMKTTDE